MFQIHAFERMEDLIDEEEEQLETAGIAAQLGDLSITSVHQLLEPGLPRKELLVRAVEQVLDQKATIFRLKHELDEAENALRSLFWVQNSLQLIRLLPDEVLGHIFLLCCVDDIDDVDQHFDVQPPLCVSQVCRHWREVAIATPELWARVPLDNISIAVSFLPRSKSAPVDLVIAATSEGKKTKTMVKLLQKHIQHTRTLILSTGASYPIILMFLSSIKWSTAPMLEYLHVHLSPDVLNSRGHYMLQGFFCDEPPPLRRFDISHIPVPWTGSLLAGGQLTHIHVSRQAPPSLHDLLPLLNASPRLVELDLSHLRIPGFPLPITPRTQKIEVTKRTHLHALRGLTLNYVDLNHEELLAHIHAPALTRVAIANEFSPGDNERLDCHQPHGLINILTAPQRHLSHLPIFGGEDVSEITYRRDCRLCSMTYRHTDPSFNSDFTHDPPELEQHGAAKQHKSLEIILEPSFVWGPLVFGSLGSAIPTPNLRSLHLFGALEYAEYHMVGFSPPTYDHVFHNLPSLRELTVEACALGAIMNALTPGEVADAHRDGNGLEGSANLEMDRAAYQKAMRCPRLSIFEASLDQIWEETGPKSSFSIFSETLSSVRRFVLARVGLANRARSGSGHAGGSDAGLMLGRDDDGLKVFKLSTGIPSGENRVPAVVPIFAEETVRQLEMLSDDFVRQGGRLKREEEYGDGLTTIQKAETWMWTF